MGSTPGHTGNRVVLLKDAAENYLAWLRAIDRAQRTIYFEMYIIHDDAQGTLFAEALLRKAGEGVQVRLLYDWMGGFGKTSRAIRLACSRRGSPRQFSIAAWCWLIAETIDPAMILNERNRGRVPAISR